KQLTPPGHASDINAVDVSLDGQTLVTGGSDASVRLWDATNGKQRRVFEYRYALSDVALGPVGKQIAVASPFAGVYLHGENNDDRVRLIDGEAHRVAWVSRGVELAATTRDGLVRLDPLGQ